MKQPIKSIKVGQKKPLVKNLLLIEGISRSGKFLLANLLSGFAGIEPVQYYGLLEHIPFLEKMNLMDKAAAREMLRCEIDNHCYEMLIGRNFNHRLSDKSSIFNNPRHDQYLKRCRKPDGDQALEKFYKKNFYSLFILHEVMPNIKIYFDTFSELKVISIRRSPVGLVSSWFKRGLGNRFSCDPKIFNIMFRAGKKIVPWFAANWGEQYLSLSEMDRCIASIEWLVHASKKTYHQLNRRHKNKILFISYKSLLNKTNDVTEKISKFLGRPIAKSEMANILKREKLPNPSILELKQKKLAFIKEKASAHYFKRLLALEAEYIKKKGFL